MKARAAGAEAALTAALRASEGEVLARLESVVAAAEADLVALGPRLPRPVLTLAQAEAEQVGGQVLQRVATAAFALLAAADLLDPHVPAATPTGVVDVARVLAPDRDLSFAGVGRTVRRAIEVAADDRAGPARLLLEAAGGDLLGLRPPLARSSAQAEARVRQIAAVLGPVAVTRRRSWGA